MSYQLAIAGAMLMIDVRYLCSDCDYLLPTTCHLLTLSSNSVELLPLGKLTANLRRYGDPAGGGVALTGWRTPRPSIQ